MRNVSRRDTGRGRAWKLMRIVGQYTLSEICTLAEIEIGNLRHWHLCLCHFGYVKQVGTRKQEGRPGVDKVFRLIKNTGVKAPDQKELRFLFDWNDGQFYCDDPERMAEAIVTGVNGSICDFGPQGITGKIKLGSGVKLLRPKKKTDTPHPNPLPPGARESSLKSPSLEGRGKGRVNHVA